MNIFTTTGTMNFMESLRQKYINEKMVVMHSDEHSLLLHETTGPSVFQTPLRYEVIGSISSLEDEGFFAFNHISVSDEGRPIFEHLLRGRIKSIQGEPGFIALRLLRPQTSNTYIVLTQWSDKRFFKFWKESTNYLHLIATHEKGIGLKKSPLMFSSAPYVKTYTTLEDEEE